MQHRHHAKHSDKDSSLCNVRWGKFDGQVTGSLYFGCLRVKTKIRLGNLWRTLQRWLWLIFLLVRSYLTLVSLGFKGKRVLLGLSLKMQPSFIRSLSPLVSRYRIYFQDVDLEVSVHWQILYLCEDSVCIYEEAFIIHVFRSESIVSCVRRKSSGCYWICFFSSVKLSCIILVFRDIYIYITTFGSS